MVEPIFISPIFLDYILPFILVFTLIFAVLQKTKILGTDKTQIDAMISLVVGLLLIAVPWARDLIVKLMPFLAISLVILLIFMLGYGFLSGKSDKILEGKLMIVFGIIFGLALLTAILIITGVWDPIWNYLFNRPEGAQIWINVIIIAIIIGAIISVVKGGKSS